MPHINRKSRKRKFQGNRFTSAKKVTDEEESQETSIPNVAACTSAAKLNLDVSVDEQIGTDNSDENDYNFNFSIFRNIICKYSCCPECDSYLSLNNKLDKKMRFCLLFELSYSNCNWKNEFETSPRSSNN